MGQIDWQAYVWREYMDNRIAACDIPEPVAAIMGPDHTQQQGGAGGGPNNYRRANAESAWAGTRAMAANPMQPASTVGADPFTDNGGNVGGGLFCDPASLAVGNAVLFRPSTEVRPLSNGGGGAADGGGDIAQMTSPSVSMDQAITGARNKNSAVFSLKNLQTLATGSTRTPIASPMATSQSTGYATGEDSGLIDIRAMAAATCVAKEGLHEEDRDLLISMGTTTGAFGAHFSSIAAPAIGGQETYGRKVLFAIVGGSIFLGLFMIAVAIIVKPSPQPVAVAVSAVSTAPAKGNPAAIRPQTAEPALPSLPPAVALSEGEKAARTAAQAEKTAVRETEKNTRRSISSISGTAKEKSTASIAAAKNAEASAAATGFGLPEKPSKDQVMSALRSVQPEISLCGQGQGGVAMAHIVIGSSGRVRSVQVTQVSGPIASCVARAVRGVRFPQCSAPEFSVSIPFKL